MLEGIKVLIADDNAINRRIVSHMMQKRNAEVFFAVNGQEAVDNVRDQPIDVLILDLNMPVMDGFEAAKAIREELNSFVPIIACTASIDSDDNKRCLEYGMNACISKPYDNDILCEMVLKFAKAAKVNS